LVKEWINEITSRVWLSLSGSLGRLYRENPRFILIVAGCVIAFAAVTFVREQKRIQEANGHGGLGATAILWVIALAAGAGLWYAVKTFLLGQ